MPLFCLSHREQGHQEGRCFSGRSFPGSLRHSCLPAPLPGPHSFPCTPHRKETGQRVLHRQRTALGPFSLLGLIPLGDFTSLPHQQNRNGSIQESVTLTEQNFNCEQVGRGDVWGQGESWSHTSPGVPNQGHFAPLPPPGWHLVISGDVFGGHN